MANESNRSAGGHALATNLENLFEAVPACRDGTRRSHRPLGPRRLHGPHRQISTGERLSRSR